jgi:hypothetical protein
VTIAQNELKRAEQLAARNVVSQREVEAARTRLQLAQAEAEKARSARAKEEQLLRIELQEAETKLKLEQDKLDAIKRAGPGAVSDKAAGEQAAVVELARLAVERVRTQLATFRKVHDGERAATEEPGQATDKRGNPDVQLAKEIEIMTSDLDLSVGVLVLRGADESIILATDRATGKLLFETRISGRANDLEVSADLKQVGVIVKRQVHVFDLRTGRKLATKALADWRKQIRRGADAGNEKLEDPNNSQSSSEERAALSPVNSEQRGKTAIKDAEAHLEVQKNKLAETIKKYGKDSIDAEHQKLVVQLAEIDLEKLRTELAAKAAETGSADVRIVEAFEFVTGGLRVRAQLEAHDDGRILRMTDTTSNNLLAVAKLPEGVEKLQPLGNRVGVIAGEQVWVFEVPTGKKIGTQTLEEWRKNFEDAF